MYSPIISAFCFIQCLGFAIALWPMPAKMSTGDAVAWISPEVKTSYVPLIPTTIRHHQDKQVTDTNVDFCSQFANFLTVRNVRSTAKLIQDHQTLNWFEQRLSASQGLLRNLNTFRGSSIQREPSVSQLKTKEPQYQISSLPKSRAISKLLSIRMSPTRWNFPAHRPT